MTVTGEPLAGDQITIVYVKEDRGTIIQSNPQSLVSTGWNLYNHETTYAVGIKYSNEYGFRIDGTYTAVKYSATLTGAKSTITPADGYFTIPANGYIWVEGGNTTDTAVYMTWSDWSEGYSGDFQAYTESVIDLSTIMSEHFPYGLLRVGDIRDEIDLNVGMAVSNVQRLAYTEENRAAAEASGRTYECDNSYIYLERETPVSSAIDINGQYTVSDHGIEYFTDTDLAVYTIIVYGNNLKNKLERDVLTISQQSLTSGQKTQVLTNIGGASAAAVSSLSDQIENHVPEILNLGNIGSVTAETKTVITKNLPDSRTPIAVFVTDYDTYNNQGILILRRFSVSNGQITLQFIASSTTTYVDVKVCLVY